MIERKAGRRHHWVSTKAVPGVAKANAHIPEYVLKNNKYLTEWISTHVGKNPRQIRLKPLTVVPTRDDLKKLAQGPFMVS